MSKLCIINTIKTKIRGNATSYVERENEIFIPKSDRFTLEQTYKIAVKKVDKINQEYLSEKFGKVVSLNTSASNGTGIKIHPSQLLIDAYEVKEGNKSIEELNPRNLEYFNGDEALFEQEQNDELKPFIDESKKIADEIKDVEQQDQEEKTIKPGVSELFESKRSFADYSDFGKTLSEQQIINLKKEGNKVTAKQFLESIIPVNDFEKKLKSFLLSIDLNKLNGFDFVINDKYQGNVIGLNERELFEKPTVIFNSKSTNKPSRYKLHEFLHSLLDTVVNEEQEFRTELITLFDYVKTLPEFKNEYGVIGWWEFYTEGMTNPDFQAKLKNVTLSGYKGGKKANVYEEFVTIINNILEKLGFVNKDYSALDEIINATTKVIEKRYGYNVKPGLSELFEQNPELASIGTPEQYSQYLDTIFPNSKVKDIVYHGTDFKFDSFEKKKLGINTGALSAYKGFFFTNNVEVAKSYVEGDVLKGESEYFAESMTKEDWEDYDNELLKKEKQIKEDPLYGIKFVKLNLKNPEVIDYEGNEDRKIKYSVVLETALENKKDSVFLLNTYDTFLFGNTNEESNVYVTFEPEQIHILGSKQDIEGFKDFVSKKINNIKADESINERLMKYEESIKIPNNVKSKVLEKIEKETEKVKEKLLSLGLKQEGNKFELITNSYATFRMKLKELENVNAIISTNKTSDFYQIIARLKNVDSTMELKKQGELPFTPIEVKQIIQEQQFLNDVADNVFEGLSEEEKQILKKKIENGDYDLNCRI